MTTPPSPLFKYRDDSERTEQIITTGSVWLSTAEHLNDPLECKTGQIPDEWRRTITERMQNAQMEGFLMSAMPSISGDRPFYSLSNGEAKRWFADFRQMKSRDDKYAAVRSFLEQHGMQVSTPSRLFATLEAQLSQVGIFSLSGCPNNELMWAHYAANHTGLAIGFAAAPGTKLATPEHTLQVTYTNEKPTFEAPPANKITMRLGPGGTMNFEQTVSFNDPTFRAAFSTKPRAWSYEEEWRYVEEAGGLFPWPGPILAAAFGLRMPAERRAYYADLLQQHAPGSVDLFEVVAEPDNATLSLAPWTRRE